VRTVAAVAVIVLGELGEARADGIGHDQVAVEQGIVGEKAAVEFIDVQLGVADIDSLEKAFEIVPDRLF
jgi:hypothetical protein